MTITRRIFFAMTALGFAFSPFAHAQEWPAKQPIKVVVPYPAGGNADSAARALGEAITGPLKQTILVDNRPGASSIIGTEAVARSAPDGYTIGVVSDSHAINQAMAKLPKAAGILGAKVPYDAVRDFVPISGTILIPLVLVVNPKIPAHSIKEVIALSKSKPAGLNFGSMGSGSPWSIHMHQLNEATGSVLVDVPYKGLAPAANDLLGGQIDIMLMPVHYAQQYIKSGKLIPVATLGAQRHPLLPQVPTLVESGYPSLDISNYIFFVAPAGTPQAIVDKLSKELNIALKTPAMKAKLATSGDPYPAEPAELSARLRRDIETYGKVIQNTLK
ncbi:Bug family tripartite tricarboxylate transporter substrate binding protein [Comamonas testosteroni]|uniref:Bug family tripartite tricarboxylate transporter substrate binding protein n=1 Tax=Comamonas testosteroni TaxID=285 RepID=UPI0005B505AE|nr:tripartite tricarboxylate transporter substrate binding protein [Comamonas testosteroni]